MHAGQFATRLTCFALLSAIEGDLRGIIIDLAASTGRNDIFPPDVREKAVERSSRIMQIGAPKAPDIELLDFIDFADIAKVLNTFRASSEVLSAAAIATIATQLEQLSSVRNRVCHSRPLEPDDFAKMHDFACSLTNIAQSARWPLLVRTLSQLRNNPNFVLDLEIPSFWDEAAIKTLNNLPLPEFDDTGFLGRQQDRREITRLLTGTANPVITIVGEGGNGKTALALRCAYDVVDWNPCPYQAVIWTSLKTRVLTATGIVNICNAITDTFGMLREAGRVLLPAQILDDPNNLLEEIADYLTKLPILLIIDNLETIDANLLRPLLVRVPPTSKVLLTSRIGLGELELRYPLGGFDEPTSVIFMRKYSNLLNLSMISKANNTVLAKYATRLFNNPLLLKWFITAVAQGADPNTLLARNHPQLESAIRFCFENLFEKLSGTERRILQVLASCPRPVSNTELVYLLEGYERHDVEWGLNTLHRSSMLSRVGESLGSGGVLYSLTPIAADFMTNYAPPNKEVFAEVRRRLNEVAALGESVAVASQSYTYKVNTFDVQTRDDRICAALLQRALDASKGGDKQEANRLIAQAKDLRPQYADSHRVSAWLADDAFRANQEYEAAIALAPQSALNRYQYAQFLFDELKDTQGALVQLDEALRLNPPADAPLRSLKARALTYLGRFEDAERLFETIAAEPDLVRRHRIATIDQCIDCYERHAHALSDAREFEKGEQIIAKGFLLLRSVFERRDQDEQIVLRTAKFVRGAMILACRAGKNDFAREITSFLKEIRAHIDNNSLVIAGLERFESAFPEAALELDKLGGFCRPGDEVSTGLRVATNELMHSSRVGKRVVGKVTAVADHLSGLILMIDGTEARAFLPKSQVELRAVQNLSQYLGQILEVEVMALPQTATSYFVVSRRKILQEKRAKAKQELLSSIKVGDRCKGIVRNVVDYGAFVEISGLDALMHVSAIPGARVKNIWRHFEVGDEVQVEVISVDPATQRVNVRPVVKGNMGRSSNNQRRPGRQ